MRPMRATALAAALLAALALPAAVAAGTEDELEAARAATEDFTDAAAAEAAGYGLPPEGPLHECIANLDGPGAMGLHYINGDLVGDTDLDLTTPEALVYAPTADGALELVALEYVVFADAWDAENDMAPMLFGEMFMLVEEPNRYELPAFYALHAWVWRENPDGVFAAFNPEVACPAATPNTALPLPAAAEAMDGLGASALIAVAAGLAAGRIVRRSRRRSA
jgi:hypothetical protein